MSDLVKTSVQDVARLSGSRTAWYLNPLLWFFVAAGLTTVWVAWSAFEYPMAAFRYGSDYWEHSAVLAEWKYDLWNPSNPHLPIDAGTPRYMPFFFLLTLLSNWFELDPIQAMALGATINMVLFSLGIWLFFGGYFKNRWAAFVGFTALVCGWGLSWLFSNLFQLRGLFFVASYPSLFVFSLSFLSWWHTTRLIRGEGRGKGQYAVLAVLVFVMLVSHPLTGAFGAGTIALMALLEPLATLRIRLALIAAVIAGALLTELWPYFSTYDIIFGTSAGEETTWIARGELTEEARTPAVTHEFYRFPDVLISLGPTLLGLPALILLLAKRRHLFIVAGFIGAIAIYLLNLFFPIPLGHRFLLFAAVYAQLALVWWILQSAPAWHAITTARQGLARPPKSVLLSGSLIAAMIFWNVALALLQFAGFQATPGKVWDRYTYLQPVLGDMRTIASSLPEHAVVIGDPLVLWPLPTFRGKTVAVYHTNPMVPDLAQRGRDVARFLRPDTSNFDRMAIIRKYGVTHILYRKGAKKEIASDLDALGTVVLSFKGYVLIKVAGDSDNHHEALNKE